MSETLQLRDLMRFVRRVWWIPVALAAVGAVLGVTAATNVQPVYRSQATVLVGPTDGSITQTSTIRASEDLAAFYADMARRQLVLEPVVEQLALSQSWSDLRNQVSAVVPRDNLRIVTVTITAKTQQRADDIVNLLVEELVSLSSKNPSDNAQAFINEQASTLKAMIDERKADIDALEARARVTDAPALKSALKSEANQKKNRLIDWQRTYVELAEAEPTADAGGLQVIDEASAVTDKDRAGMEKQAVLGSFVGSAVGVLITWFLYRRKAATGAPDREVVKASERGPKASRPEALPEEELPLVASPREAGQVAGSPLNGTGHSHANGAPHSPLNGAPHSSANGATPSPADGDADTPEEPPAPREDDEPLAPVAFPANGTGHRSAYGSVATRERVPVSRLGYGRVSPTAARSNDVAGRGTGQPSRPRYGRVTQTIKRLAGSRPTVSGGLFTQDKRDG